jgi:hypothetical protein
MLEGTQLPSALSCARCRPHEARVADSPGLQRLAEIEARLGRGLPGPDQVAPPPKPALDVAARVA